MEYSRNGANPSTPTRPNPKLQKTTLISFPLFQKEGFSTSRGNSTLNLTRTNASPRKRSPAMARTFDFERGRYWCRGQPGDTRRFGGVCLPGEGTAQDGSGARAKVEVLRAITPRGGLHNGPPKMSMSESSKPVTMSPRLAKRTLRG